MLSFAVAMGGYAIASMLHLSGPLAMVVAGLIIGNKFHLNMVDDDHKKSFNEIWEIFDEILNGILFLLIGLALHLIEFNWTYLYLGIAAIIIVLIARFISVYLPFSILKNTDSKLKTTALLTWGGLRGGISLALALSLPRRI